MALCYKDKTFCKSDCVNTQCHRNFSPQVSAEADAWAESFGLEYAPIAMSDFSGDCDQYLPDNKLVTGS